LLNQKGGVGKTTTAVNLGAYLAQLGKRVLLVDIDPQANATSGLGINHQELPHGVYEAIIGAVPLQQTIQHTVQENYKVAPATIALAGAGVELVNLPAREFRLEQILQSIRSEYDYVIVDSPPSLGLLTLNGLVAAEEVIIPVQCEYYALEGLGQLLETIGLIRNNLGRELKVKGARESDPEIKWLRRNLAGVDKALLIEEVERLARDKHCSFQGDTLADKLGVDKWLLT